MGPLTRLPVTVSRVTAIVIAGVEGVCEISSQPVPSLNTGVGETKGSNGFPNPVITVIVPPPIRLAPGQALGPNSIASASLASHAGTSELWNTVPAGASSWNFRIGDGLAFGSPGFV